jgi:hypothetical protein
MKISTVFVMLAVAVCSCVAALGTTTFTVINTDDSGIGSLREAITDANATPGADTIIFDIPGAGQKTITVLSDLPAIMETVTIDGGNSGVASNRVELAGAGVVATGLQLNSSVASNSVIRNLVINGFTSRQILFLFSVTGCTIQGNFIGLNAAGTAIVDTSRQGIDMEVGCSGNLIGGATAAERNVISSATDIGIVLNASDSIVQGNFIGLNAAGSARAGNPNFGVFVGNGSATIGGTNPGEGNVIVALNGIEFGGNPALGHSTGLAQGNFIGTDATGMTSLSAGSGTGINVSHATGVVISGGNVISGNSAGVIMSSSGISGASSDSTTVQGNFIGTAADGVTALGNAGNGVDIFLSNNNTIGGTNSGDGNVIAFNGVVGVRNNLATGNRIEGNSIFSNGDLGIDQDTSGVSLNDFGDFDGAQNFPRITAVTTTATDVNITGTLSSRPNTAYRLEFFGNTEADPSGFGEGQVLLGTTDVTSDGAGGAAFDVTFPTVPLTDPVLTFVATAIDADGDSSEFSHAFGIKLQNISTRLGVLTGENVLIGGFIITGDSPKQVVVRAIGPALGSAGLEGALEDPVLELHEASGMVVTNDNWKDSQQAEIEATGLQPNDDLESAIVATLDPGPHTAIVTGKDGGTGIGLVEVYDIDAVLGPILANISTRGFVDMGDNVMIGGFIVGPTDTGLADVLIRAIGPSLSDFGIANPLLDPVLELHDSNGALLTTNDNWKDTQQTEIEATELQPTNDSESAILETLAPGAYTAIVRGVDDTTGVGLVEVYNLPNTL